MMNLTYTRDTCKRHTSKTDRDLHKICPSKLSRTDLEGLYFTLLDNNLELKQTVNGQQDDIKILNTKLNRMTAAQKSNIGKKKDCCAASNAFVQEQRDYIDDLKRNNDRLNDKVRVLNMKLCSAKQFLRRSPSQANTRVFKGFVPASFKNSSVSILNTKRSESSPKTPVTTIHYATDKEQNSTRTVETETSSQGKENSENVCNENKCKTEMEELKQKVIDLQEEMSKCHKDYSSRISRLESEVETHVADKQRLVAESNHSLKQRDERANDLNAKLRNASVEYNDMSAQLLIEKSKVAELETRLKAMDISNQMAKTIESRINHVNETKQTPVKGLPHQSNHETPLPSHGWNESSPLLDVPRPTPRLRLSLDTKTSFEDTVFSRHSDDSGYTDANKSQEIKQDDDKVSEVNKKLMKKILALQQQLDLLKTGNSPEKTGMLISHGVSKTHNEASEWNSDNSDGKKTLDDKGVQKSEDRQPSILGQSKDSVKLTNRILGTRISRVIDDDEYPNDTPRRNSEVRSKMKDRKPSFSKNLQAEKQSPSEKRKFLSKNMSTERTSFLETSDQETKTSETVETNTRRLSNTIENRHFDSEKRMSVSKTMSKPLSSDNFIKETNTPKSVITNTTPPISKATGQENRQSFSKNVETEGRSSFSKSTDTEKIPSIPKSVSTESQKDKISGNDIKQSKSCQGCNMTDKETGVCKCSNTNINKKEVKEKVICKCDESTSEDVEIDDSSEKDDIYKNVSCECFTCLDGCANTKGEVICKCDKSTNKNGGKKDNIYKNVTCECYNLCPSTCTDKDIGKCICDKNNKTKENSKHSSDKNIRSAHKTRDKKNNKRISDSSDLDYDGKGKNKKNNRKISNSSDLDLDGKEKEKNNKDTSTKHGASFRNVHDVTPDLNGKENQSKNHSANNNTYIKSKVPESSKQLKKSSSVTDNKKSVDGHLIPKSSNDDLKADGRLSSQSYVISKEKSPGAPVVDDRSYRKTEMCEQYARVCNCPKTKGRHVTVFRTCSGTQRFRVHDSKLRRCHCIDEVTGVVDNGMKTESSGIRPSPAPAQPYAHSRGASPDNTDHEISSLTDLPSEDGKSPREVLSPGEDKPTTMCYDSYTSTYTDNPSYIQSLSEGELPVRNGGRRRSSVKEKDIAMTAETKRESVTQRMEAALNSIGEELARCKQLIESQRPHEVNWSSM